MEDVKPISELLLVSYLWQLNIKVWKQIISKLKLFSTKICYKLALLKITLITPLVGTILESSPLDQRKDIQSERPGSSDDSDSICSFTHSYNSLSEGSYELAPWHGKLSMSWESIGPDVMSSNLFLAPENAGNS